MLEFRGNTPIQRVICSSFSRLYWIGDVACLRTFRGSTVAKMFKKIYDFAPIFADNTL